MIYQWIKKLTACEIKLCHVRKKVNSFQSSIVMIERTKITSDVFVIQLDFFWKTRWRHSKFKKNAFCVTGFSAFFSICSCKNWIYYQSSTKNSDLCHWISVHYIPKGIFSINHMNLSWEFFYFWNDHAKYMYLFFCSVFEGNFALLCCALLSVMLSFWHYYSDE